MDFVVVLALVIITCLVQFRLGSFHRIGIICLDQYRMLMVYVLE